MTYKLSSHAKLRLKQRYRIKPSTFRSTPEHLSELRHVLGDIYECRISDVKVYPVIKSKSHIVTFLTPKMVMEDIKMNQVKRDGWFRKFLHLFGFHHFQGEIPYCYICNQSHICTSIKMVTPLTSIKSKNSPRI